MLSGASTFMVSIIDICICAESLWLQLLLLRFISFPPTLITDSTLVVIIIIVCIIRVATGFARIHRRRVQLMLHIMSLVVYFLGTVADSDQIRQNFLLVRGFKSHLHHVGARVRDRHSLVGCFQAHTSVAQRTWCCNVRATHGACLCSRSAFWWH